MFIKITDNDFFEVDSLAEKLLIAYSKEFLALAIEKRIEKNLVVRDGDINFFFATEKSLKKRLKR